MKILVAEDDRATRLRIGTFLRGWGYEVIEAADGAEAWEEVRKTNPPIVVTDWQMPEMDGVDLIRKIRSDSDPTYHYTILLTSRSEMKDVVEGLEAGADDFVAKPFDKDELRVRVAAGERIITLEHSLEEQNRKLKDANTRMKESLLSAAKIQQSYLPSSVMEHGGCSFAFRYEPCDELAGDTLNYIPLDGRHVALYAIDVSGHGVPAALLSVHLSRILTRMSAPDTIVQIVDDEGGHTPTAPAEVVAKLNRRFEFDTTNQQYFTMIYGVLDTKERRFCYCSAGHPGPVVVSDRGVTVQKPTPPAVGFLPRPTFSEQIIDLQPGDRLLFYTDGVFEAMDDGEEEFGEQRLAEAFHSAADIELSKSLSSLIAAAREWSNGRPFDDDISLMAAEIG